MTLRRDLSAKSASQYEGSTEFHTVMCFICEGLHYTRYCPHENWDTGDWMTGKGNLTSMSNAGSEYHSSGSIPDERYAQSPGPDSQGSYGDYGDSTGNMHMNWIQDLHGACSLSCGPVRLRTSQLKPRVSLTGRRAALWRAHVPPPYHGQDEI